jgi:hypothetical protein
MRIVLIVVFVLFQAVDALAQCAMCRSTLENNYSNGNPGIGAGINTGILYLLILPYLAIIVVGFFWFKSTKNAEQNLSGGHHPG